MKKLFKWPGGKTKELKIIKQMMPKQFDRVVEPFAGAATLSFDLEMPCWVNDIYNDIPILYNVVGDSNLYPILQDHLDEGKDLGKDELVALFYQCRDYLNDRINGKDPLVRAFSFIVERQLAITGMLRFNRKGELNASFGHGYYETLSHNLTKKHHIFVHDKMKITNMDFESCIKQCEIGDFIFVDPPYVDRAGYESNFKMDDHIRLCNTLGKTKAKWMLIHVDCEEYRDWYKAFNIVDNPFQYSQNWGKRINKNANVKHLYITNY